MSNFEITKSAVIRTLASGALNPSKVNGLTEDMALEALEKNFLIIQDMEQTPEFCLKAIERNYNCYKFINNELKTPEFIMRALDANPDVFVHIVQNDRTYEIWKKYLLVNPLAFSSLPYGLNTEELWIDVLKNTKKETRNMGHCLSNVPNSVEVWKLLCDKYPVFAINIPLELLKDDDLLIKSLAFIPDRFYMLKKTPENIKKALDANPTIINQMDENTLTPELCLRYVQKHGKVYSLPENKITPELVKEAIRNHPVVYADIPLEKRTPELLDIVLENIKNFEDFSTLIDHIPDDQQTNVVFIKLVNIDCKFMEFIPKHHITNQLCRFAIFKSRDALKYITDEYYEELIKELARKNSNTFNYLVKRCDDQTTYIKTPYHIDSYLKIQHPLCNIFKTDNGFKIYKTIKEKIVNRGWFSSEEKEIEKEEIICTYEIMKFD